MRIVMFRIGMDVKATFAWYRIVAHIVATDIAYGLNEPEIFNLFQNLR